jgi:hypothetical protein
MGDDSPVIGFSSAFTSFRQQVSAADQGGQRRSSNAMDFVLFQDTGQ